MKWVDDAQKFIKNTKIPHRNWDQAYNDTLALLATSAPGEVICITGPSRAGKSRLVDEIMKILNDNDHHYGGHIMTATGVLATNCSTRGEFSTKAFTIRALEAVNHPIYGVKYKDLENDTKRLKLLSRTSEGILRPALESALIHRETKYLFIDEAQHIHYNAKGPKQSAAILDSWKCLAQATGVIVILVGAYPIMEVIKNSPHLLGRKQQIHMPRYRYSLGDVNAFSQILDVYSKELVLPKGVDSLNAWAEYLYEGSMGCIGLLEAWIRSALAVLISYGSEELTLEHFKISRRPSEEEKEIAKEIMDGEKLFENNETGLRKSSDNLLYFYKKQQPAQTPKRKPFQRNPKRYGIGHRS